MRKARVWKPSKFHRWAFSLEPDDKHGVIYGYVSTHAEAMFLAQLLADPERYISQAERRAWAEGHKAGVLQEYFRVPGVRNTPSGEIQ